MGSLPQLSVLKGPTRQLTPKNLAGLFESVANSEAHKTDTALIFQDASETREIAYEEVDRRANSFARAILSQIKVNKAKPNSDGDHIIAVNMHPSDHLVIVLLAIWKTGAAYLPLDHAFPGQRIEHILLEAGPVLIIHDQDSQHYRGTATLSLEKLDDLSAENSQNPISPAEKLDAKDDLAIVLYTSGSTGIPKGVRLPHRVILNRLRWQFKTFPYNKGGSEKVCVFKTALTFVDHVAEVWGPLINGLCLVIVPKSVTKDPEQLIDLLDKYQVQRLVLVPSLLRSMLMYLEVKKPAKFLRGLKLWICSGETLTVSLADEFFRYFSGSDGFRLCNFYGSTEIMGDVTFHVITGDAQLKHQTKIPIGVPVDNTIIYLLDPDFRPVKAGHVGELFVSGLNLASGYVNGRDKEKFIDNQLAIDPSFTKLYRTGDFARIEKGALIYEGRTDSQVKIRGHRVDLSEVEKTVNGLEGIEKAVVLCYKPGEMNQALLAFVQAEPLMNETEIENILRTKLTPYMVPQVILLDTVPLLVNGKIDRQALLARYENTNNNNGDPAFQAAIDYTGILPSQMEAAKVLFETVASVLNRTARSAISVEANFYEIGGNSLNSIYTITKLNEHGYHLGISDFISAIDLGEVLERMTTGPPISTQPPAYSSELLKNEHKSVVIDMITSSFYQKADLEQWLMPDISEADYTELMDELWEPLVAKNLSFVTKSDAAGAKVVGVALSFDAHDEPEVAISSKLNVIFEFLESIEGPIRDDVLPGGKGKLLHSFMMATHSTLSPKENVAVMQFMEDEVLGLATARKFEGIFTTNTSPLTQQLGTDVYNYQTLLDCQVNKYVASDGSNPFGSAPDSQRALVQWKVISHN